MKTVTASPESEALSKKPHVAILFEGPWFFTQDPTDKTNKTILAICPYTDNPDHVCEFVDWSDDNGVSQQGINFGTIEEGDTYSVDVSTDLAKNNTFKSLFEAAHKKYKFAYLQSTVKNTPLKIISTPKMRRVSIPIPDSIHAAGKVDNALIRKGDSTFTGITHSPSGKDVHSYVTFIFIYEFKTRETMKVVKQNRQSATADAWAITKPHLVVRVRNAGPTDEHGCFRDCSAENTHVVSSFESLRRMALLPTAKSSYHCDIAFYPPVGKSLNFSEGVTGFGRDELGLPPIPGSSEVSSYAACAAGPMPADGIPS